jgi:CRISPR-associated protein Cas2
VGGVVLMVVMILEKVPVSLRGELTRWLIEPRTGVFVGHISARVRDNLWEKCSIQKNVGGVVQVWSTNVEQHFKIRMTGDTSRTLIENEGLQLIKIPGENNKMKRIHSKKGEEI